MKQPSRRPTAFKRLVERFSMINPTGYLKVFVPNDAAIYRVTAISETIEDHYVATLEERPCWRSKQAPPPAPFPPTQWKFPSGMSERECAAHFRTAIFAGRGIELSMRTRTGLSAPNGRIHHLYVVSKGEGTMAIIETESFELAVDIYDRTVREQ